MLVTKRALRRCSSTCAARRERRRAPRRAAPRHADHRPHAAPAGQPDHLRAQGRGLGARASTTPPTACTALPPRRTSSAGRSARSTRAYKLDLGLDTARAPVAHARNRIGELAGALGVAAGAVGKAALDVILLSQTEVAEVRERRGGGSTSMPHKHNPVAAISALGCAKQAPGLVATLLAAMVQEHERGAGSWHSRVGPAQRAADRHRLAPRAGCAPPWKPSRSTPTACASTATPATPRSSSRKRWTTDDPLPPRHRARGRARPRPLQLARRDAADVGPAGEGAGPEHFRRDPLRHARPRRQRDAATARTRSTTSAATCSTCSTTSSSSRRTSPASRSAA